MSNIICPICNNSENNTKLIASEKLIGTRESFSYGECDQCKSVFLLDKIEDFAPYYPSSYHCFDINQQPYWKKLLLQSVYKYNFWWTNILWKIVTKLFYKKHWYIPEANIRRIRHAIELSGNQNPTKDSIKKIKVLDLWCGAWELLQQLSFLWFQDLTWVEPFGTQTSTNYTFFQSTIIEFLSKSNTGEKYDVIVLSHVLEHLYDHHIIIEKLKNILSPNGVIVIAMPFTWKLFNKYKENRLSLDAPRHVIIHSIASFQETISKHNLVAADIWYEQKWRDIFASEMYSRDIWFTEINSLKIPYINRNMYDKIADTYNKQQSGWSSVTFFITH